MPQAIAAIGWWLAGASATSAVAISVGYFLIGAAQIIGMGLLLMGAAALQNKEKKKAKQKYNASQTDRMANVPTTTGPRELVLGTVRKGGVVVFRDSIAGGFRDHFYLIIAIASHEIDGVEQFFFNDVPLSLDANGYVLNAPYAQYTRVTREIPGAVPNPPNAVPGSVQIGSGYAADDSGGTVPITTSYQEDIFNPHARIQVYTGSDTQAADAEMISAFPGVWTANHRLQGIAYLKVWFRYNESVFPTGIPTVTAIVRGARCLDPRTGVTAHTKNPALHAMHVLRHPNFGKRASFSSAETARFIAAANACDTSYTPIGGAVGRLYESNTVFAFGLPTGDALDDLCQAMCGMWAYAGGEMFIKGGVHTAAVKAFTQSDIVTEYVDSDGGSNESPITVSTHRAKADKVNSITPKIWDSGASYKETVLPAIRNAEAIAADQIEMPLELPFPTISRASQASVVANFMLKDSRDPLTLQANFKLSAYPVELFDNITLSLPRYGWTNKLFMVLSKMQTSTGSIQLMLKETSAAIYDPLIAPNSNGFADNTEHPNPWDISAPVISGHFSGTDELLIQSDGTVVSRVRVTWDALTDARVTQSGRIEVQWNSIGSTNWNSVWVQASDSQAYLTGVQDGDNIIIRARSQTALATSQWCLQVMHTVVGKSQPPSTVPEFSISVERSQLYGRWTEVPDYDRWQYEIRLTNSGWGEPGEIFRGQATSAPLDPAVGLTWYIKAIDRSGNYSVLARSVSFAPASIPNVTNVRHIFTDTSLTAATVTLHFDDAAPQFGLDGYRISYGSESVVVRSNDVTLPANWIGERVFLIQTLDRYGLLSPGFSYSVTKLRPASALNFRAQVIDNDVLLYWNLPARTSLPIAHCIIRRGASWELSTLVGTKDGEFTSISELAAGNYTYWIAVVDTDGYASDPVSLTTSVSQPPDFVFNAAYSSIFDGVLSNALLSSGVLMPVNLTETFEEHFTDNSWLTPDAQIDDGFPLYIQPGASAGYYEEEFDYGTALASSSISVSISGAVVAGTPNVVVTTSISIDGVSWTDYPGLTNVFALNFRYVKVRVAVNQTVPGSLYRLTQLEVRLDSKLKTDVGVVNALSTDVDGTIFNFNSEFVDVISISPGVESAENRLATYAFLDAVLSGTYSLVSNVLTVSVTAHQMRAGQRVRLAASSGALPLGVYQIDSVIDANQYAINLVAPNTSGNLTTYPNSARIYVRDPSTGVRQSATVSIAIRGS